MLTLMLMMPMSTKDSDSNGKIMAINNNILEENYDRIRIEIWL